MKIVSVYYTHKPGGFCKRLYRLLGALSDEGHEVYYLTLDLPPDSLAKGVNIQLIPFPLKQRKGLFFWALFTIWCPLYLAFQAKRLTPDRIVVFGAYYSSMSQLLKIRTKAPVILFLRSLVFRIDEITNKPFLVRRIAALVERMGMNSADKLVVMTQAMKVELEGFLRRSLEDAEILPNEVPKEKESSASHRSTQNITLLTSGVLDQRKNVSFLIDALIKISRENVSLTVAGDGPLLSDLKNQAAGLPVSFPGWLPSLEELYPNTSLVIHPSLHEGIPNSLLEAMAAGVPVLASDIPEHRELLVFDELLFSLNDPSELSSKIQSLDESSLKKLSELTSERAQALSFDWNNSASKIVLR